MTSRAGGGLLTITGSLSEPGTVTVGGGTPYVTGSASTTFTAVTPVVAGSNNIVISATDASSNGVTRTLSVNVSGGTPIPSLTYDFDGNLTNDGTQTYEWDSANRLTTVNEPGGLRTQITYDGLGRRAQIVEINNGTVTSTKNLVWDGMTICEEKNASDAVTKQYFDQGVRLGGSNYYYTRDHLGSIREVIDSGANILARYDYDPYGRQTQLYGTMTVDFGYTGQYFHQPSDLMMAPYREYAASLGRWISRDPAGERSGINLYDYVLNNPIDEIDLMGLCPAGHHLVPQSLYKNAPKDVKDVFDDAENRIQDPNYNLHNGKEYNGVKEPQYRQAVRDELDDFLESKGKDSVNDLTPDEAQQFASQIKYTEDGPIGDYNEGVMNEMMEQIDAGAVGPEGKEGAGAEEGAACEASAAEEGGAPTLDFLFGFFSGL